MDAHTKALPRISITVDESGCEVDDLVYCGAVQVAVGPDEDWATFVDRAVASQWVGIEALGAIPGTVEEVVVRSASAWGQHVAGAVVSVRTLDTLTDAVRTFAAVDCAFSPGSSRFQETLEDSSSRYRILEVTLLFRQGDITAPVRDTGLAALLGVEEGARVPLGDVLSAVRNA